MTKGLHLTFTELAENRRGEGGALEKAGSSAGGGAGWRDEGALQPL